jgi:hypothetical protein
MERGKMNDVGTFGLFIQRANEIETTRFWRSLPKANWGITMGLPPDARVVSVTDIYTPDSKFPSSITAHFALPQRGDSVTDIVGSLLKIQLPDQDDLRSFLVVFRRFVAQKELLHLLRIYNTVEQCLPEGFTKDAFKKSKGRYKAACRQNYPSDFTIGDTKLKPEYAAVHLWMQGHVFHDEPEKIAELGLDAYEEPVRSAIIFQFVQFALNATREILLVRQLLKRVLKLNLV